ncbi:MAG: ArsR family transcriptional regulator [Myxococcaceae bacterium]|nr:MAG: ArsR family transcriptional regulator [Myxococcaceae bacterium]
MKCKPPERKPVSLAVLKEEIAFAPSLDERAELLSLLGNGTRLRMLALMQRAGEICVCDMAEVLGVTQSAVSQQLAKLRPYRLVESRRENQTLFYRLADTAEAKLARKLALDGVEI